jgi:hypothetical protein
MIVFFVRKANDVDHLTPVVYRLSQEAHDPILVLCLSPRYDVRSDYRLNFLSTLPRVTVTYQFAYHAPTLGHRLLATLLCGVSTFRRSRRPRRWIDRAGAAFTRAVHLVTMAPFFERKYKLLLQLVYHDKWAEGLLARAGATLLVFDWAKPYQHNVGSLLKAARRLGVPAIALPHGVDVYTGDLRSYQARKTGVLPDFRHKLPYDMVVVPHADQAAYYQRCGVAPEKLKVLGSARFCAEWVQKNLELSPPLSFKSAPRAKGRVRVLLMDKPTANRAGLMEAAVQALAAMENVDLVVRPATRNETTTLSCWPDGVRISRDSSARLIEWCDVVVGTMSSILIEPVMRGKPVICLRFVSDIPTVFTRENVCIAVDTVDDLVANIERMKSGTAAALPPAERVAAFLHDLVGGHDRGGDVLGEYTRFLVAARMSGLTGASKVLQP